MMNPSKMINVLGEDVKEDELKASLQKVLKKRGLSGSLIIENEVELKKSITSDYSDYGNVYKYAFF